MKHIFVTLKICIIDISWSASSTEQNHEIVDIAWNRTTKSWTQHGMEPEKHGHGCIIYRVVRGHGYIVQCPRFMDMWRIA